MRVVLLPLVCAALAASGCARLPQFGPFRPAPRSPSATPAEVRGVVSAPAPPAGARTAAQFDTTTEAQRIAARDTGSAPETPLGDVVVSLGDPGEPGLWLRTALVDERRGGRVVAVGGAEALVELIPTEGGSRLSLSAMRLLGLPLTDLPTLAVYAR